MRISRRRFLEVALAAGAVAHGCGPGVRPAGGIPFLFSEMPARVTGDSALVHIAAEPGRIDSLEYIVNDRVCSSPQDEVGHFRLPLRGLEPGGRNVYQLRYKSGGRWSELPQRSFQTRRRGGETFVADFIADSHLFDYDVYEENLAGVRSAIRLAGADAPDLVVFMGDETWAPYKWELRPELKDLSIPAASALMWRNWRQAYSELLPHQMSLFVIGNHEGLSGYNSFRKQVPHLLRAKKAYCPQPTDATYPEGGENEGFEVRLEGETVNMSPLENYFALTWGDALFAVIDVQLYTNLKGQHPATPEEWTLGAAQLAWLERTLRESRAAWKFVLAHHLVGGWDRDSNGTRNKIKAYGRGGARYCDVGEQRLIHEMMRRHGATAFIYGHDHIFCHQQADGIHYLCCGKPNTLDPRWWEADEWRYAYPEFTGVPGFTRMTVRGRESVEIEYVRTAHDPLCETRRGGAVGEVIDRVAFSPPPGRLSRPG